MEEQTCNHRMSQAGEGEKKKKTQLQHLCAKLKHLAEETLFRWLAEVLAGSSSLLPVYDELHGKHKVPSTLRRNV